FDNLGLYELIRRQLQVVIVLDGEQDFDFTMAALYSVAQRVKQDFDTSIELDGSLDKLAPVDGSGFPLGAKYVSAPYLSATIRYPNNSEGRLIYVKLSLDRTVSFAAKGYRAQHMKFPHEPTANQFF